ncbi:SDR family oxidoreductase, partial [uncultured Sulfitobacter sp.]
DATRAAFSGLGAVDIVVNSAGMARHGPALDTTPEDFDAVMNVNLRAAYFLSTAAADQMIAAGRPGSIIHVSSQMGHVGGIDRGVYCASKHALEGMVKAMAIEWGPKAVRINTLCPTFIRTPLGEQTLSDPARLAWIEEKIKLGRVGEIEDIMGPIVYLASDASAMVTGTALMVDGGWTAE